MSKIAVIGPKELRLEVLTCIHELGLMHIDEAPQPHAGDEMGLDLLSPLPDEKSLAERVWLDEFKSKVATLLSLLPETRRRESFLNPAAAVPFLSETIDRHLNACRELRERLGRLGVELRTLRGLEELIRAAEPLLTAEAPGAGRSSIALRITDREAAGDLEAALARAIGGNFELSTAPLADGALLGILTTEKERLDKIEALLKSSQVEKQAFPRELQHLPLHEQVRAARGLIEKRQAELDEAAAQLGKFATAWGSAYIELRRWLDKKLQILQATAALFETDMCFILFGWIPSRDLARLTAGVIEKFGGRVIVEEREIKEQELERVPIFLSNPPYFKPFELFARLLPIPAYSSFDLTPFIGIFFPVFFGMMLGDAGYGIVLLLLALFVVRRYRGRKNLRDAGKILSVAAAYTLIFGLLFGEMFGSAGRKLLGLRPIFFDREHSILPMLYFALAMGTVHVFIGLLLGLLTAIRKKMRKEALFKFLSMLLIILLAMVAARLFTDSFRTVSMPLVVVIAAIIPLLFIGGGLLAPLEVLKHIGNIISYARIMAIGLTSVLLASVANHLAGMTGSIWLGIFVAIILHAFNLALGLFAPTIHSLRLHYVEFFSKFMEPGGKEFKPLGKDTQ